MSDVSVSLGLDAREFDARLAAIEAKVAGSSQRMGKSFGGIGQILSVATAGAAIKSVIEYGAKIEDLHQRFGVSTDAIQHFGNAAEKNGSSLEAMTMGFNKLEISRSKAMQGDQALADAFLHLGVTMDDLKKLAPEDLMMKLGASSLYAADTVKLLGKNALELRPTLAGLADGTIKFSGAINSIDIERLKKAQDTITGIKQQGTIGLGETLGAAFHGFTEQGGKAAHENLTNAMADSFGKIAGGHFIDAFKIGADFFKNSIFGAQGDPNYKPASSLVLKPGEKGERKFDTETDQTFQQVQEAQKMTLGELAGTQSSVQNGMFGAFYKGKDITADVEQAKKAQQEKELAQEAAFKGDEKGFNQHNQRFEQITSGIGSLKDSEKNIGVKEMVQDIQKSAAIIAKNTETKFVNK